MRKETVRSDLTVVGGGIAGTCAAVQAARLGLDVALVNDRPVLGGNSSSEVRVWVNGATGGTHNRYAREGGIMEEILLENKSRNPDGNADLWDLVLLDLVEAEDTLSLHLNTLVDEAETADGEVVAVEGTQNMSETHFRFESPYFVDATGDGSLAVRTGAEWTQGREAADTYGERAAPDVADEKTLGSSIMFYSERADEPVAFEPPAFACDFREDPPEILAKRTDPSDRRCMYWWIEYGGEADLDPVHDNEAMRDELMAMVYGAWDYIKNSGDFDDEDVADLRLDWAGKIPGKRESRRFVGDYVLTEDDLVEQRRFPDAVGHGGWSIDLHPPAGFYDDQGRGSEHWHLDGPYAVPYRTLYPEGSENLFLAGRHVSASHVAFGSLRVQMTLATLGQAVGAAAALAEEHDETPPGIDDAYRPALQQLLLREDQWVVGERNADEGDHVKDAAIRAMGHQSDALRTPDASLALDDVVGVRVPGRDLDAVELRVENETGESASVPVEVWTEERPENYVPHERTGTVEADVPADRSRWIEVPIDAETADGKGIFLVVGPAEGVRLHGRERELSGVLACRRRRNSSHQLVDGSREFSWPPTDVTPCFVAHGADGLFAPENVADGFSRPFGRPRSWVSEPVATERDGNGARLLEPPALTLEWPDPKTLSSVQVTFNTDLTPWYNALTPTDEPTVAECVRDYHIQQRTCDGWTDVVAVDGNYRRFRRHTFDPVETDAIRLVVDATNGVPWAEVFELRAYGPGEWPPLAEI
jgi:hypothetical protein